MVNKISLENFESLLHLNNSLNLNHEKWFKSLNDSSICLKVSPYDLKPNNNKRVLVYENNILSGTENIIIKKKK